MDVEYVRKLLEIEKRRALSTINSLKEHGLTTPLRDSIAEFSLYDNHPADVAAETYEREKDLGLLDNARLILHEINRAEEKLAEGTYGYCDSCGSPISEDRLRVLPYATRCIHCEENTNYSTKHRPVEEDVLQTPFARSFTDGDDIVVTDGEDIWQEVEQYGSSATPQDYPEAHNAQDTYVNSDERRGAVYKEDEIGVSYDHSKRRYVRPKKK